MSIQIINTPPLISNKLQLISIANFWYFIKGEHKIFSAFLDNS